MVRSIAWATLIAGTLDILYAALLSLANGRSPAGMLRFVASGPFPAATEWGAAGSLLGLAVHFALMAIMAAAFVYAADCAAARSPPLHAGARPASSR